MVEKSFWRAVNWTRGRAWWHKIKGKLLSTAATATAMRLRGDWCSFAVIRPAPLKRISSRIVLEVDAIAVSVSTEIRLMAVGAFELVSLWIQASHGYRPYIRTAFYMYLVHIARHESAEIWTSCIVVVFIHHAKERTAAIKMLPEINAIGEWHRLDGKKLFSARIILLSIILFIHRLRILKSVNNLNFWLGTANGIVTFRLLIRTLWFFNNRINYITLNAFHYFASWSLIILCKMNAL